METTLAFALRLFLAGAMGAVIGVEREYRAKEAGYRTHFLVALGSAAIMIVSQHGFHDVLGEEGVGLDPSRIAAQVVTGIGFIGAGTIILNKQIVRGLTTAAGIWVTSGIGLAIGAGMFGLGICATVLTLIGLEALSYIFRRISMRSFVVEFSTTKRETPTQLTALLTGKEFLIVSYQMEERPDREQPLYYITMVIKVRENKPEGTLMRQLQSVEDVTVHRIE
ncbi:MAG: MgtC/SapB family protein [Bacteroides sp.]|nr:MgtC/SapB family protein [Bacteroides sp.]